MAVHERPFPTRPATPAVAVDARAWLAWTLAAAYLAMTLRNPLYLLLLLLAARLVLAAHGRPDNQMALPIWRLGALMLLFSALFNGLSLHAGQTVLFRLPAGWPLIGGSITLEAFVLGAVNGLMLLALLAVFVTLNGVTAVPDLVRLTPRAFQDLGLVVLLAITYVPETLRQLRRIQAAQAIRGHRLRRLRDWRPIVIPLLVGGLERSMALAESMVARGFGATQDERQSGWPRAGLALGLAAALAGWTLAFWVGWPGWLLLGLGLGLLLLALWRNGRRRPRTHYRARRWRWTDSAVMGASLLPLLLLQLPLIHGGSLVYTPLPRLTAPPFAPAAGLALLLLALPALLALAGEQQETER